MSDIQVLVDVLTAYKALPHHHSPTLKQMLSVVQNWQKQRIRRTNHALFSDDKTAPLANYLINRIYGDEDFELVADQLLLAGQNALNGSGKLEKLIPTNALGAGVMGVVCAIEAVKLDLALAECYLDEFSSTPLDETLLVQLYQKVNAKDARTAQIYAIGEACQKSHQYFSAFLLQNAFKLAKNMAYHHGYQPLYDFIGEGLTAMKPLKRIEDFTAPFVANELAMIEKIHTGNPS